MKISSASIKWLITCIALWSFIAYTSAATTQLWRDILNQFRADGLSDDEIRLMIEDLWYNADEYLWSKTNQTTTDTTTSTHNAWTTQLWWDILNQFRADGRSDEEIQVMIEDLWMDASAYFWSNRSYTSNTTYKSNWNSEWIYTSRSCKTYDIQYIESLWVYTSPDLKKREYFVNTDYFKRYIDSKNAQLPNCPTNEWRIDSFYEDTSNSSDRFTAPNWKVYFITNQNWYYTSNELSNWKTFSSIVELKSYIRDRNPLIYMWNYSSNNRYSQNSNIKNTIDNLRDSIFNL